MIRRQLRKHIQQIGPYTDARFEVVFADGSAYKNHDNENELKLVFVTARG